MYLGTSDGKSLIQCTMSLGPILHMAYLSEAEYLQTCRENRDVNKSCSWVSGRLFQSLSVEPLGLFHINGLNLLREAHFSMGLGQADQRLQLSGVGRHHATTTADLPHVHIGLRSNT